MQNDTEKLPFASWFLRTRYNRGGTIKRQRQQQHKHKHQTATMEPKHKTNYLQRSDELNEFCEGLKKKKQKKEEEEQEPEPEEEEEDANVKEVDVDDGEVKFMMGETLYTLGEMYQIQLEGGYSQKHYLLFEYIRQEYEKKHDTTFGKEYAKKHNN